ncbi:MAG: ABC transporter permease [Rubellimicrobium sp.]|nr:ABC transporter permease [Rubellimicrobium sp.]
MLIFGIARLIPGDPARIALGPMASNEQVEAMRDRLLLNEPITVQYLNFIKNLVQGDLGTSLYTRRPVTEDILSTLPATFELVLAAALIMTVVGVPLGILAARYRHSGLDIAANLLALLGVVTPSFVWGIFLMLLFAFHLDILPIAGRLSRDAVLPPQITGLLLVDSALAGMWATFWDALRHITLPATALAMGGLGTAARLTRANMSEVYGRQYIQLARAFGYTEREIAYRYALRPAMVPTLTILGLDFAIMLGNAFLVEKVFAWPGMARYGVEVIIRKDLNGIVGTILVISAFFLIINMIIDIIVAYMNPRILYQNQ